MAPPDDEAARTISRRAPGDQVGMCGGLGKGPAAERRRRAIRGAPALILVFGHAADDAGNVLVAVVVLDRDIAAVVLVVRRRGVLLVLI